MNKIKNSLLTAALFVGSLSASAQTPKGWHLQDPEKSGNYGINLEKAYEFLKKSGRKSNTVIVAVLDSGIDTTHEDLKPVLWRNPKEIPGNGKDDDGNGYIDDVFGWNFLGSNDGTKNVTKDSYERERVYHKFKEKWDNKEVDVATLSPEDKYEFEMWQRAKEEVAGETLGGPSALEILQLNSLLGLLIEGDSLLSKAMGKDIFTGAELEAKEFDDPKLKKLQMVFVSILSENEAMDMTNKMLVEELKMELDEIFKMGEPITAPEPFRANVVNDKYEDFADKYYGNGNVQVDNESAFHGTHVAGIIAAARNNKKGVDGVADNVKIMSIRAVPDGDEHDKDIALGIRYAVDNGAKVINMSFGKGYSPEKKWVDEAIEYANEKGVLLVHAAGNDAADNDVAFNFPTSTSLNSIVRYPNWIEVGASGPNNEEGNSITARFSNYGKEKVDVFAPGVQIYSTIPGGDTYGNAQGTSMASPVVAGIAGLILQYYPELSPAEVKEAIEKSVVTIDMEVYKPGTKEKVKLSDISKTGGVVDAHGAVKYAAQLAEAKKGNNKPAKQTTKPAKKAA